MSPEERAALDAEARTIEGEHIQASDAPQTDSPTRLTTGQVLTMILIPTFAAVAPAWRVTDGECAVLGEAYGALADKYFPDVDLGVEFAAVVATAIVFGPRLRKPRREPEPESDEGATTDAPPNR